MLLVFSLVTVIVLRVSETSASHIKLKEEWFIARNVKFYFEEIVTFLFKHKYREKIQEFYFNIASLLHRIETYHRVHEEPFTCWL